MTNITKEILDIFETRIPDSFDKKKPIRQHQVQLALDVADFLFNKNQKVMFVEAPVGTGKSYGVLVPTLLYAKEINNEVLYGTATINLQNQLFENDTPVLSKIGVLRPGEKILAQGKNNYSCQKAFEKNIDEFNSNEQEQLQRYFTECRYGWLSELENMFPDFDRKKFTYISMGENDDLRDYYCKCKGHTHREEYKRKKYRLTITNHDQLIQSFINQKRRKSSVVKIDSSVIVIDEAHFFKENYLGRTEKNISYSKLKSAPIESDRGNYFKILNYLKGMKDRYMDVDLKIVSGGTRYNVRDNDYSLLKKLNDIINSNITKLEYEFQITGRFAKSASLDKLESLNEDLNDFLDTQQNKSWLQFDSQFSLHFISLHFNSNFNKFVADLTKQSKVIIMSGTLTTGDVEKNLEINWGMKRDQYIFRSYPSVFDYSNQAIVYVPHEFPHPNNGRHLEAVKDKIKEIVPMSQGGTLILCTSNEYVFRLSEFIKQESSIKRSLFVQGEESVPILSSKFEHDSSSILIGSGSFFTGFSVEGESLDKVILTKLPYPPREDPYIDLLSQGYDNQDKFNYFIIPSMLMKLEQGMGRLIRSRTDYGSIAITDKRALEYPTKSRIEKLGYKVTSRLSDVSEFHLQACNISEEVDEYSQSSLQLPSINSIQKSEMLIDRIDGGMKGYTHKISSNLEEKIDWLKGFYKKHKEDSKYPGKRVGAYNKLKSEREIYEAAVNFLHSKGIDYHLVFEEYPFTDDTQKETFSRISPTTSGPVI